MFHSLRLPEIHKYLLIKMAGQYELSACHKSPTIFITTITFIIGIFTAFELPALKYYIIFGTIKGIIS
jgi:hypothetical protein